MTGTTRLAKMVIVAAAAIAATTGVARAKPAATSTTPADRAAIDRLLATYTHAVSSRDQALFETILLDRDIPFAYVGATMPASTSARSTVRYEAFRKGVFEGAPFVQTFGHVHIEQDGALAQASMIFRNRGRDGTSWGFKTMQLLKVGGLWKIASEFFTVHDGARPQDPDSGRNEPAQ